MTRKVCDHCGAKMVEYKHTFSEALAEGLLRLYRSGSQINLKHLDLTRNQWDNFQKLRYWDLVEKFVNGSGKHVGGTWIITQRGKDFVNGHMNISRHVYTYRGDRVRYVGEEISFKSTHPAYKTRPIYASEAENHQESEMENNA